MPHPDFMDKTAEDALTTFADNITKIGVCQFGGDASTGLGFTTVTVAPISNHQAQP